jgi:hypothetical protein
VGPSETLVGYSADGGAFSSVFSPAGISQAENDSTQKGRARVTRSLAYLYGNVSEQRLTAIAAGVTYFALLAMFPFVGAIVAIYGLSATPLRFALNSISLPLPTWRDNRDSRRSAETCRSRQHHDFCHFWSVWRSRVGAPTRE